MFFQWECRLRQSNLLSSISAKTSFYLRHSLASSPKTTPKYVLRKEKQCLSFSKKFENHSNSKFFIIEKFYEFLHQNLFLAIKMNNMVKLTKSKWIKNVYRMKNNKSMSSEEFLIFCGMCVTLCHPQEGSSFLSDWVVLQSW